MSNAKLLTEHAPSYSSAPVRIGQVNACPSKHSSKVPTGREKEKLAIHTYILYKFLISKINTAMSSLNGNCKILVRILIDFKRFYSISIFSKSIFIVVFKNPE